MDRTIVDLFCNSFVTWNLKSSAIPREQFIKLMERGQFARYSREEVRDAWIWFLAGYLGDTSLVS